MGKKYYEVVFEGDLDIIYGLLEGFKLGKGKNWVFFICRKEGIKTEALTDVIAEWITFGHKLHHVAVEDVMFNELKKGLKGASWKNHPRINDKFIKSARAIKGASFKFEFEIYGKKYGEELKALMKTIPKALKLKNYNPVEKLVKDAKGIELYTPEHEYSFEGGGEISGDFEGVMSFRKKLDGNPLVKLESVKLSF